MLNNKQGKIDNGHDKAKVHIVLSGRVQGVAFRYYARNMADKLGVKGWIRNLDNGDVEAVIEGKKVAVQQMVVWCKKGPSLAVVENISIDWQAYTGEFHKFNIS